MPPRFLAFQRGDVVLFPVLLKFRLLIKEAVMLDSSDGINSANNGYDNDNDMGEIGG